MNAPLAAVRPGRIAVASAMVESGLSREKHICIVHCASQQYLDDSPLHPCPSGTTSAAICAVWMGIMADMPVHACAGVSETGCTTSDGGQQSNKRPVRDHCSRVETTFLTDGVC